MRSAPADGIPHGTTSGYGHYRCRCGRCTRAATDARRARRRYAASEAGRVHNGSKTHCVRNHEFTPENTQVDKRGYRVCRACRRARYHEGKLATGAT